MDDSTIARTVDATGLACPMPLVRTRHGIDAIASGEILRVLSTDRGSLADLPVGPTRWTTRSSTSTKARLARSSSSTSGRPDA